MLINQLKNEKNNNCRIYSTKKDVNKNKHCKIQNNQNTGLSSNSRYMILENKEKQSNLNESKVLQFSLNIFDCICLTLLECFKCCKCLIIRKSKEKYF